MREKSRDESRGDLLLILKNRVIASIKKFIACCTVNINEFNFIIISEYAMNEKSRFSRSKTVGKPR